MMFKAGPGQGGLRARPGPRRPASAWPATAARPGPTRIQHGREVRGRHPDHLEGRQVRRRAHVRQGRRSRTARRYFDDFLLAGRSDYQGPYKDRPRTLMGLEGDRDAGRPRRSSSTSSQPFADFDYLAALPQTAPVPPAKDTGTKYQRTRSPSGPYMFESYQTRQEASRWCRNPQLGPGDRPEPQGAAGQDRRQARTCNADDIDNQLLAGDLDVDIAGTGVQPAAQAKVLADAARCKAHADNPVTSRGSGSPRSTATWRRSTTSHCRKAVVYAADHESATRPPTAARSPVATSPPR